MLCLLMLLDFYMYHITVSKHCVSTFIELKVKPDEIEYVCVHVCVWVCVHVCVCNLDTKSETILNYM